MFGRSYAERHGMMGLGMLPSTLVYALDNAPSQAQWEKDHGLRAFGVGSSGTAVVTIRDRIAATGISEAFGNPPTTNREYDNVLATMVQAFRHVMGMAPGSIVDYETWFVLNQRAYETARGVKPKLTVAGPLTASSTSAEERALADSALSFDISSTARAAWNRGAQLAESAFSWFSSENAKPTADEQREEPKLDLTPALSIVPVPSWALPVAGVLTAIVIYRSMNKE